MAVVWGGLGLTIAVLWQHLDPGEVLFAYQAAIVFSWTATGFTSGLLLYRLAAVRRLIAGALFGHIALALPAIHFAHWAASLATREPLLEQGGMPIVVLAYAFVLTAVATAILCAGATLGLGLQAAARAALRKTLSPPGT